MERTRKFLRTTIDQPNIFVTAGALNLALPKTSWASDDYSLSSGGIGSAQQSTLAGVGEFLERRHFCTRVPVSEYGYLRDVLPEKESAEWINALTQTGAVNSEAIVRHTFPLTRVLSLDGEERLIPTATVRVTSIPDRNHDDYFRFHDTSGCSIHTKVETAMLASVREQIERQCLLIFWLTAATPRPLPTRIIYSALRSYPALHEKLIRHGELSFFDITIPGCPGYAVLAVYKGAPTTLVKYCPGLSYGLAIETAVEKAFLELWQSYNFLVSVNSKDGARENVSDRYQLHFLECDNLEMADEICNQSTLRLYEPRNQHKEYKASELIAYLREKLLMLYLYIGVEHIGQYTFYAAKALSPGMFLHMDNSRGINLKNRISSIYYENFSPARISKMVPFP